MYFGQALYTKCVYGWTMENDKVLK